MICCLKGLLPLLFLFFISSLASPTSLIDAQFKLNRLESEKNVGVSSSGVSFYQNVLSRTLGSQCTLFPNDSRFTQINFRRCGSLRAAFKSMARFYMEPDAVTLGYESISDKEQIKFEDFPGECAF